MTKYKNLIVWQKTNLLALKVYKLTEDFPQKEFSKEPLASALLLYLPTE